MAELNFSVLSNPVVYMAIGVEKTDDVITKIKVWLKTLEALADSVVFITANNLEQEIFAKAGVNDTTYFNLLTETDSYTSGDYFVYEVQMSHSET